MRGSDRLGKAAYADDGRTVVSVGWCVEQVRLRRDCMTGEVTEEPVELAVVSVTDGPAHKSLYLTEGQARVLRDVLDAALRNVR